MKKDVGVQISDIKCSIANKYHNDLIKRDYMIEVCDIEIRNPKSVFLKQHLLSNIKFLNYTDEFGKLIKNCNEA
jgi:hypothetical protein